MLKITSQEIRKLIDDDLMPKSEKLRKLRIYLFKQPWNFWPAVSIRMLGKKRLAKLETLALEGINSGDNGIKIASDYLKQVILSNPLMWQ